MKTARYTTIASTLLFITWGMNAQHSAKDELLLKNSFHAPGSLHLMPEQRKPVIPEMNDAYGRHSSVIIQDSLYYYLWDDDTHQLKLANKTVQMEYNAQHKKISEVTIRPINQTWVNVQREEYTYDSRGNQTVRLDMAWNGTTNSWYPTFRVTSTYDCRNNLILHLTESPNAYGWENYGKETFTYDSQNNILSATIQDWVDTAWANRSRKLYTYNHRNRLKLELFQQASFNGSWFDVQRRIYHYNKNNNNDVTDIENLIIGNWEMYIKVKKTYNNDDLVIKEKALLWTGTEWITDYTYKYTYGKANTLKDVLFTGPDNAENMTTRWHYYFHQENICRPENTTARADASISTDTPVQPVIYPNPSSGSFSIAFDDKRVIKNIEVFNLFGEKVVEQTSTEVNISNSAKGFYIVKINDGDHSYQYKILVE